MFSLDKIRFLDSYMFLDTSIDILTQNLIQARHDFNIFNSFFKDYPQKELLKRKEVFPYQHFSSINVLDEKQLRPQSAFYNSLCDTHISNEDYDFACNVFKSFKCNTLKDYLEIYQDLDVILLAEIFTSFRRMSEKFYALDPVHFISCAQLTFAAGLKCSKIELKLLSNVTDYIWFEKNMRGGISLLGKIYVTANNPYLPETYDSNLPNN